MARNIKRYPMTLQIPGNQFGSSRAVRVVRQLIKVGKLPFREMTLRESERLDILAGQEYGNTRLWWVIAAASDIGWGLQCPVGTYLRIPKDLGIIANAL